MSLRDKILLMVLLTIIVFCIYIQWISGAEGDKGWYLFATGEWLKGKALYTQLVSVQPPLIFWLYAVPVWIAAYFTSEPSHILILCGMLLIALSMRICCRLAVRNPQVMRNPRIKYELALLLAFIFIVWTNALYFIDRDHLFLVLAFPYVMRWMPSVANQTMTRFEKVIIGILAGIGFCIKPHCIMVFLAVQLLFLIQQRSLRILWSVENILIYSMGIVYLSIIMVFYPEFYHVIVPMALATYSVISLGGGYYFGAIALLLFSISFIDFPWRSESPYRRDILYLLGLCAGFLAYALLNNGWAYSWNLLYEMILFTTGWVIWHYRYLKNIPAEDIKKISGYRKGMVACIFNFFANTVCVLALYLLAFTTTECRDACKLDNDIHKVIETTHAHSFGTISMEELRWARLARTTTATWDTRINQLWMLPKFFISDDVFRQQNLWILEYVAQAYAEDLDKNKPDLMFVDDTNRFYSIEHDVDLVEFLSFDSAFRQAWGHYSFLQTVDYCMQPSAKGPASGKPAWQSCKYIIYQRRDHNSHG